MLLLLPTLPTPSLDSPWSPLSLSIFLDQRRRRLFASPLSDTLCSPRRPQGGQGSGGGRGGPSPTRSASGCRRLLCHSRCWKQGDNNVFFTPLGLNRSNGHCVFLNAQAELDRATKELGELRACLVRSGVALEAMAVAVSYLDGARQSGEDKAKKKQRTNLEAEAEVAHLKQEVETKEKEIGKRYILIINPNIYV